MYFLLLALPLQEIGGVTDIEEIPKLKCKKEIEMRKLFLCTALVLFMMTGMAQATLTTIGTVDYRGGTYKLIWEDNNNGESVIWLDYKNAKASWQTQVDWASSLNTSLRVTWYDGVTVDWGGSSWRLPNTVDGVEKYGFEGPDGNGNYNYTAGYNLSNSEMGHLYYEALDNLGFFDTSGNGFQPGWGLNNKGDFGNLAVSWYWSGTEYADAPSAAWYFSMGEGAQDNFNKSNNAYGLAVRSGQVSVSSVPVPGAMILLGAGLLWVAGLGRKNRRDV